jgi:O-antigen/teichoic acid export membrane protein
MNSQTHGGRVLTAANLAAGVLLARALGADGKGTVALATTTAAMVAAVLGLRWERSCGHFLAREGSALPTVFTSILGISGWAMGAAALLGAIGQGQGWRIPGAPPSLEAAIVALVGAQVLYVGIASIFGGLREFETRSRFLLSFNVAQAASVTMLYAFGAKEAQEYLGWGALVSWLVLVMWLRVIIQEHRRVIAVDLSLLRRMARFSRASYWALLLDLVTVRLDVIFLGYMISPAAAGVYSVAVSVGARLASIPQIIGYVVFHRTSASELGSGLRTAQICRLAAVVMGVVGLLAALLASAVIIPLYGQEFALAIPALWIMVPATGIWGMYRLLTSDIEGRGRPGLVSLSSLAANVTIVGLDLLWIPRYGLIGAAWASLVAYAVALVVAGFLFCRVTGLGVREAYAYRWGDLSTMLKLASEAGRRATVGMRHQSVGA